MKLYHNIASTCSQKVRLVLAEKNLAFESEFLDLQRGDQFAPDYLKLNPNAVVPTLEDGGQVYIESTLINEYLDDAYPETPMKPADAAERHRMRHWCKRIDALHPACGVQTYAIAVRPNLQRRPASEVQALVDQIPDKTRRETRRSVIELGVQAPSFRGALAEHVVLFDALQTRLNDHDWLAGDSYSLADAALLPYVLRVEHIGLGSLVASRLSLAAWFERIQQKPAYAIAVAEYLPQALIDNFAKAAALVEQELADSLSAVGQ